MTKMFKFVSKRRLNAVVGCEHDCSYCWAKNLAEGKLRHSARYKDGFKPQLIDKELDKYFKAGELVFVSSMGDLFGRWVPEIWILRVLNCIRQSPEAEFLLLTKNPIRYHEFWGMMPDNIILGATIETNRTTYGVSKAPRPYLRYKAMLDITGFKKMIAVEPAIDFDVDELLRWIYEIKPDLVAIGYDNYKTGLNEPPLRKILTLIDELEKFTKVEKKTLRERIGGG